MCVNEDKILRMKDLIKALTEADIAYYRDDDPVMSDREYDQLTDELLKLEAETGLVISGSPTQKVSGEVLEELTSVRHTKPMLSAKKTKSIEEMVRFAGGRSVLVSWKLDGLTIVLRYENGELKQSITRGREGTVGEDVTHTIRTYLNVPLTIPIRDSIEVRGEGVISWRHFNLINSDLEDTYSHPRNLAAGSTRKLDANESRKRLLEFFAFDLVSDHLERPSKLAQMQLMQNAGFSVVPFTYVDSTGGEELLRKAVDSYKPEHYGYPVDGLIVEYDDRAYGASLGATGHHENRMIALKWKDDPVPTKFLGVDLATTRTGRVSITGLFEPVAIDGAMVSRAYLHNLDIFDAFQFGVGDEIMVYKANQIIPQIAENKTKSGTQSTAKKRFALSEPYAPEKSKISEDNPTLAIPLPDGTYLRAVGYPTDTYPCIDIYWDNGINAPTDTLCFVEFNPNHEEDERVCIGAYRSNQDDPTYYAPYMAAERNANNE